MSDIVAPEAKKELLDGAEELVDRVEEQYSIGALTYEERRGELVKIWTEATDKVSASMEQNFPEENPVLRLVNSGASGNWMQVRQLAGMRGLVTNPKGEIIPRPIKSNYREGLSVLEYFIASHGARKGLADTALRTADSGYLTRRLVDVSQDVIVRAADTDSAKGITLPIAQRGLDGALEPHEYAETSVYGRLTVSDVKNSDGEVIVPAKTDVNGGRHRPPRGERRGGSQGPLRPHGRFRRPDLRDALRTLDGDRSARGHRRGDRHRCGAVDR